MALYTVNEQLQQLAIKNVIEINKYSNSLRRRIVQLLKEVNQDIKKELHQSLDIGEDGIINAPATIRKLRDTRNHINFLIDGISPEIEKQLNEGLVTLGTTVAEAEADRISDLTEVNTIATAPEQLESIVTSLPFQGAVLQDWLSKWATSSKDRIWQEIQTGVVMGRTIRQMVSRIAGTAREAYKNGITQVSVRGAEAIVRTSVTHVSNQAREIVYMNNQHIVKSVKWVSTLDSRTSLICASRDGQVFQVGQGPRPPAHINCRSTTTPILKSYRSMGVEVENLPDRQRASMDGKVPGKLSYTQWLREQSKETVVEVLGKERARLFLEKNITVDRFVDKGDILTIEELKARLYN